MAVLGGLTSVSVMQSSTAMALDSQLVNRLVVWELQRSNRSCHRDTTTVSRSHHIELYLIEYHEVNVYHPKALVAELIEKHVVNVLSPKGFSMH